MPSQILQEDSCSFPGICGTCKLCFLPMSKSVIFNSKFTAVFLKGGTPAFSPDPASRPEALGSSAWQGRKSRSTSVPRSTAHWACGLGQITRPFWVSVSSFETWAQEQVYPMCQGYSVGSLTYTHFLYVSAEPTRIINYNSQAWHIRVTYTVWHTLLDIISPHPQQSVWHRVTAHTMVMFFPFPSRRS